MNDLELDLLTPETETVDASGLDATLAVLGVENAIWEADGNAVDLG